MNGLQQRVEALEDRTGMAAGCPTPEERAAMYAHALELARAIMVGPEPEPTPGAPSARERIRRGWEQGGWA